MTVVVPFVLLFVFSRCLVVVVVACIVVVVVVMMVGVLVVVVVVVMLVVLNLVVMIVDVLVLGVVVLVVLVFVLVVVVVDVVVELGGAPGIVRVYVSVAAASLALEDVDVGASRVSVFIVVALPVTADVVSALVDS